MKVFVGLLEGCNAWDHAGKACNSIGKGCALRDPKKIQVLDKLFFFGFETCIL